MKLISLVLFAAIALAGCGKKEEPVNNFLINQAVQEKTLSDGTVCVLYKDQLLCNWKQ